MNKNLTITISITKYDWMRRVIQQAGIVIEKEPKNIGGNFDSILQRHLCDLELVLREFQREKEE